MAGRGGRVRAGSNSYRCVFELRHRRLDRLLERLLERVLARLVERLHPFVESLVLGPVQAHGELRDVRRDRDAFESLVVQADVVIVADFEGLAYADGADAADGAVIKLDVAEMKGLRALLDGQLLERRRDTVADMPVHRWLGVGDAIDEEVEVLRVVVLELLAEDEMALLSLIQVREGLQLSRIDSDVHSQRLYQHV